MSGIWEVYDNEQVQLVTRRQAAITFALIATALLAAALLLVLAREAVLPRWLGNSAAVGAIGYGVVRFTRHLRRTSHVVWCVKISASHIAGYDYARRETSLCWSDVTEIDLTREGLCIRAVGDRYIDVPHLFTEFPALSHRIVEHADHHHVPTLIEGMPVDDLDLHAIFPFLASRVGTA